MTSSIQQITMAQIRRRNEKMIGIRKATDDETQAFLRVSRYFDGQMPEAISDEQADSLPDA